MLTIEFPVVRMVLEWMLIVLELMLMVEETEDGMDCWKVMAKTAFCSLVVGIILFTLLLAATDGNGADRGILLVVAV